MAEIELCLKWERLQTDNMFSLLAPLLRFISFLGTPDKISMQLK